jgi:hypothetical protein
MHHLSVQESSLVSWYNIVTKLTIEDVADASVRAYNSSNMVQVYCKATSYESHLNQELG